MSKRALDVPAWIRAYRFANEGDQRQHRGQVISGLGSGFQQIILRQGAPAFASAHSTVERLPERQ